MALMIRAGLLLVLLLMMQPALAASAIEVRVPPSSEATPQPGDLVGEAGPVTLSASDSPVDITIDRVVE